MKSTEKKLLGTEKQRLIALCEAFHKWNNVHEEEQVSELFLKVAKEEYAIAFCGHFSAGKSSLINTLSNTGILPASPIPTSANIVKMKKGKPRAVVTLKNKKVITFPHPYDVEEIKSLCKDSEHVNNIEIYIESDENAQNITFYDTPGIDSTDPAHKKATENVVYLADLIFYVMDYNHILSETNVAFIQSLLEKGKTVRLIVNQIDKHRDEELTFKAFKENVFESFRSYGINKEQIFFTSVKDPSLPHNDISALIAYFKKIEMNKDQLLLDETNRQINHLVTEFIEKEEEDKNHHSNISTMLEDLVKEKQFLLSQINQAEITKKEREESLRSGFVKIVESAQLMPYETREKAGLFIESAKKDFKVGLLFSKQKTENERTVRKATFQEKLQESIDAHINWHAENYINDMQKQFSVELPHWEPVKLKEEILYSHVQSGLSAQGQGLINYCDNIAGEVKKLARKQISECMAAAMSLLNDEQDQQFRANEAIETELNETINRLKKEKEKALVWEQQKTDLLHVVSLDTTLDYSVDKYEKKYMAHYKPITIEEFKNMYIDENKMAHPQNEIQEEIEKEKDVPKPVLSLQKETEKLYKTASLLKPLSGFYHMADELNEMANRLQNRSFTMVLFGAFSAGKSSFANALFGESILPSSPNPTTAAINKVCKPDEAHPHGTVVIMMKTEEEILGEINPLIQSDSNELSVIMNNLLEEKEVVSNHLEAFKEGYQWAKNHVNQSITTDLSEIGNYAAIESKACYVKEITIYYSCPLTEKGLVLVDTPGANSIHSRHTDVAFEYMKHADIIIYLTYFNHAFSYADREFLIQLGRIKDTFESDKMFFSINAADLANSEEDKMAVVDHVKSNLQSFGIRNPRLFPVSSKNELIESKRVNSGFNIFTQSLFHYLENELEQTMILRAAASQRHAQNVVQHMLDETRMRLQQEDDYLSAVEKREDVLLAACSERITLPKKQLKQEMKELLYYVKQRVLIRYHDFYKETIHPAAVQSSKNELLESMKELYAKLAHDLQQEYRACSLRLDKWIQIRMKEREEGLIEIASEQQVSLNQPNNHKNLYHTPIIPSRFDERAGTDIKVWASYFKNAKQFFEQGGSNDLKNDLSKRVESEVEMWMEDVNKVLNDHYENLAKEVIDYSRTELSKQVVHYFAELKKPGNLENRISELEECLNKLKKG
ncbi:dynamin family protein [Fictibacillus nanhaiensis]|uniref:dynamin family protein n=1 Tax=Fictibacillus nanhaiensis TaxID=742169 RepID=UPI001C93958F|nr:dynamin family protein [Fictibacillus nanhaiensis]MBY6035926.1 dynamin family protein [Fictibacillus nanhaiensis]